MYRSLYLILFACCTVFAGSMVFDLQFDEDDLSFSRYGDYDRISLPACGSFASPGEPLLPARIVTLVIPADADNVRIMLEANDPLEIRGSCMVQPAAIPRTLNEWFGSETIDQDPEIYSSRGYWPSNRIQGIRIGCKTGFRLLSFRYYPLAWNPGDGSLLFLPEASARISWESGEQEWHPSAAQIESAEFQLAGWIDNPEDLSLCRPVSTGLQRSVDYLVISSSDYSASFNTFVSWKNSNGISTEFVDISDVLSSSSGYDDPEKLRNYIIGRFQNDGVKYVLLAGDESVLPVRMINLSCEGYTDNAACDLYFSDLSGSWDANGDHNYGQPEDSLDLYSDIAVGRALFDSPDEAALFVGRSMTYQQNPPSGDWTRRAMLCGAGLFQGYTGAKVCDSIAARLPVSWKINKAYESPSLADGFTTHIDVINSGTNWNHYAGHGNEMGIYWQGSPSSMMTNTIAQGLSNGNRSGIHHSIACMPGSFHHNYDCCADALWHNAAGGAVSVMFNTSYGWEGNLPEMGVSEWMCVYLTEEVFQLGNMLIGPAFATSKDRRVPLWNGGYDRELYCILDWCAFHDPTLRVNEASTGVTGETTATAGCTTFIGAPRPNPARAGTGVLFPVSVDSGSAVFSIYDMNGRLVWNTPVDSNGEVCWNTGEAAAGVYLIYLTAPAVDAYSVRRLVILP